MCMVEQGDYWLERVWEVRRGSQGRTGETEALMILIRRLLRLPMNCQTHRYIEELARI